jgi:hypothetical protein
MSSRPVSRTVLVPAAAGLFLLLAPPARAQSAVSSVAPSVSGVIAVPGGEAVICTGQASVTATAVADPAQPGVLVSVDVRGLSCVGAASGARYVNTGQATLTRVLVPSDVVRTTFAVYKDVPGGFLDAHTGLLVVRLAFDATTGAVTSAAAELGSGP